MTFEANHFLFKGDLQRAAHKPLTMQQLSLVDQDTPLEEVSQAIVDEEVESSNLILGKYNLYNKELVLLLTIIEGNWANGCLSTLAIYVLIYNPMLPTLHSHVTRSSSYKINS